MSDHGFLTAMLFAAISIGVVGDLILGYRAYRVYRMSERNERLVEATYLEVRKALQQQQR
jgi:hypothetical protein